MNRTELKVVLMPCIGRNSPKLAALVSEIKPALGCTESGKDSKLLIDINSDTSQLKNNMDLDRPTSHGLNRDKDYCTNPNRSNGLTDYRECNIHGSNMGDSHLENNYVENNHMGDIGIKNTVKVTGMETSLGLETLESGYDGKNGFRSQKVSNLKTYLNGNHAKRDEITSTANTSQIFTVFSGAMSCYDNNDNLIEKTSANLCNDTGLSDSGKVHFTSENGNEELISDNSLKDEVITASQNDNGNSESTLQTENEQLESTSKSQVQIHTKYTLESSGNIEPNGDFNGTFTNSTEPYGPAGLRESTKLNTIVDPLNVLKDTNSLSTYRFHKNFEAFYDSGSQYKPISDGIHFENVHIKDTDKTLSIRNLRRFNNPSVTSSNSLTTHDSSGAKQISQLISTTQKDSRAMIVKPEKFNSTPDLVFTFKVHEDLKDFKVGQKVNVASSPTEKYGFNFVEKQTEPNLRKVGKVSTEPDKSLSKVVEEIHDDGDDDDVTNDDFSLHENGYNNYEVSQTLLRNFLYGSSNYDNKMPSNDNVSEDQHVAKMSRKQNSENDLIDQSPIQDIINDGSNVSDDNDDISDDGTSTSDDSEVDFELRAQLLAQINPLLLAPGVSDHHDHNSYATSDSETESCSTGYSGSTIIAPSQRNDLERLKGLTERLKLNTKRPSFVAWKEQIIDKPYLWRHRVAHQVVDKGIKADWSSERLNRITEAIAWLGSELMDMRVQDQVIAQQLIALRKEIHCVKLEKLTAEHQDMIEDACEMESERRDELAELDDAPPDMFSPTLKHFGLTPMNISTRRFSVF